MDRRTIWAVMLIMVIAVVPAFFLKRPAGVTGTGGAGTGAKVAESPTAGAPSGPAHSPTGAPAVGAPLSSGLPAQAADSAVGAVRVDTIRVTSPLYTYAFSTVGGRMIGATLPHYRSLAVGEQGKAAQIIPFNSELLDLTIVVGRDTVPLRDWAFTPSAESLAVNGPSSLRFMGTRGDVGVELTYTFSPNEYQVGVSGRVTGVGPNGGQLLVGMGPTLANTEADPVEKQRGAFAIVTKRACVPARPRTI